MKVLDAGVVVELLVGGLGAGVLGDADLAVPHLVDSEVTSVLRRLLRHGDLAEQEATAALVGFTELELIRFPAAGLRVRMWALRHNVGAYDATYLALAETLAVPLLTTDVRLARVPDLRCEVALL